ncbi:hypothetical protein ACJA3J_15075 [Halobacillus sp. SY10]|uniref:structural cement protein Gp24 n=1 Tax=Halobacillus sp. SY10 TaxID=3381356 RepID=UPI003879C40B
MAITEYNKYMPEAQGKGKLANYQDYSAETKAAAEDIPYGVAVQLGTDRETVSVFAGGSPVGIALAQEPNDWQDPNANNQLYKAQMPVAIVRKGPIWVEVEEDVNIGDKAVADNSTGNFRPEGTATSNIVAFPTAVFKTAALAGELAQLEINLP